MFYLRRPAKEKKVTKMDWALLFVAMVLVPIMVVRVILHAYYLIQGYPNSLAVGAFWLLIFSILLDKELKKAKSIGGKEKTIKTMWIVASFAVLLLLGLAAIALFAPQ